MSISEWSKFFKECYKDYPWNALGTNFWWENEILSYKSMNIKKNHTHMKIILKYE